MNRFKTMATILCMSLLTLMLSPMARADDWNKKTVVTFNQPVEIPGGVVLPAGVYVFKLLDSSSNRHIVQIFNEDQTHIYATILAIPNYRLQTTDKTVMTFGERSVGSPEAIRSWFYPGANSGEEFVYPRRRAIELAKANSLSVLAMPTELEAKITAPSASVSDEPVVALKAAPVIAVQPTGEEAEIAQVVTPPPVVNTTTDNTANQPIDRLPQTASSLPLIGLIGLLSLCAGIALLAVPKRVA